jgi:arabinogalactan endo-1,4-beta-galactosidase
MNRREMLVRWIAIPSLAICCQCGGGGFEVGADAEAGSNSEAGSTDAGDVGSESSIGADLDADLDGSSDVDGGADVSDADAADAPIAPSFFLGADITFAQQDVAAGATYLDNGVNKPILMLLKDHGFNYIRLRTFVDPTQSAPNPGGGVFSPYSRQGFGDLAHTVSFGQLIKAAGMGFLLDFHYSDYWADPGKQIKPAAWVNDNIDAAVTHLHDYTLADIQALVAAGARPDMVQIGNEITPGILLSPGTALGPTSTAGWPQLARLLIAGIDAVHQVDPTIKIMLHLDRGGDGPSATPGSALDSSISFIQNAMKNNVPFDVFGESCYITYQGQPSGWQTTFSGLVAQFPNLKFVIAEYNADPTNQTGTELRLANDIIHGLKNQQGVQAGLGTFFWEPTRNINSANQGMFTVNGNVYSPIPASINQYDQMTVDYGL